MHELRPIEPEETREYMTAIRRTFGWRLPSDSELSSIVGSMDFRRSLAVVEQGRIVATAGAFTFEMTVPGGSLPTAGVTRVTVQPTHRRRGLLTEMMRRQLDDIRELAEPLAILYASEAPIYGRFGYGPATWHAQRTVPSGSAFARGPAADGTVSLIPAPRAADVLLDVWGRAKAGQPGMVARDRAYWDLFLGDEPDGRPSGATALYVALYEESERPQGLAIYRLRQGWTDHRPDGTVLTEHLIAVTPPAYAALWRFLLDIDLMASVTAEGRPAEEPLRFLLADARAIDSRVYDGIWLRIVDLRAALAGRRYAVEGELVLDVADGFCDWNAGRYRVQGGPDAAECAPSRGRADLALDVSALAACYLGGNSFRELARAGLVVEHSEGALSRADAMFAAYPPPWCPVHF